MILAVTRTKQGRCSVVGGPGSAVNPGGHRRFSKSLRADWSALTTEGVRRMGETVSHPAAPCL